MTLSAEALETVDLLYRAAIDSRLWPDALDKFARSVGCVGMAMIPITPSDTTGLVVSPAMDEVNADYQDGWYRHDSRVGRIFNRRLSGGVVVEPQLFSDDEIARDPFRQDFCRKWGIGVFAAQLVEPWPGQVVAFSVQRGIERGHFESEEIETLNWLGPHAARALTISQRLRAGSAAVSGLLDIVDRFDGGVVILNGRREVTHVNASAQAALGDGLSVSARRLAARDPRGQAALDALIASAVDRDVPARRPTGPIAIARPSGRKPLLVQALPLRSADPSDPPRARGLQPGGALVLVVDPDPATLAAGDCLRLLGLTAAEARLAALVGTGMRRRDAAARLSIAESTARDAMKHVYSKLSIRSQGELVRIVTRVSAVAAPAGRID